MLLPIILALGSLTVAKLEGTTTRSQAQVGITILRPGRVVNGQAAADVPTTKGTILLRDHEARGSRLRVVEFP